MLYLVLWSMRGVLNSLEKMLQWFERHMYLNTWILRMLITELWKNTVIINFVNKTEKNYSTSGREMTWYWVVTTEALICKGVHAPRRYRVGRETEDNLFSSLCFLEHITCSLLANERTIHSLPFLPFFSPSKHQWYGWN